MSVDSAAYDKVLDLAQLRTHGSGTDSRDSPRRPSWPRPQYALGTRRSVAGSADSARTGGRPARGAVAEPGLMAMGSGRFYGWVIGGVLPAALGADWLVSAWDQNTGLRYATPATAAAEEVAADWLLDHFRHSAVG